MDPDELFFFCSVAKIINKKGHLEAKAILKFTHSTNHKKDMKLLLKFYKLELLHRSDTYELTPFGRMFALDKCEWFKRYK